MNSIYIIKSIHARKKLLTEIFSIRIRIRCQSAFKLDTNKGSPSCVPVKGLEKLTTEVFL